METQPRNLPGDLPGLAREIEVVMAREAEIETDISGRDRVLLQDFQQKREALSEEAKARHHPNRIELGHLLLAARALCSTGKEFELWLREHTQLARSTAFQYMQLAKADDPKAAEEQRKADQTARKRKQRERAQPSVTAGVTDKIEEEPREPREPITYVPPLSQAQEPTEKAEDQPSGLCSIAEADYGHQTTLPFTDPGDPFWWRKVIEARHTPTTSNEALKLYNALTHAIDKLENKASPYLAKAGKTLLQAQDFFTSKTAWEKWLRANVRTCEMTRNVADRSVNMARMVYRDTEEVPDLDLADWLEQEEAERDPVLKEYAFALAKDCFNRLTRDQRPEFIAWATERVKAEEMLFDLEEPSAAAAE